ncbi:MAG: hypothetical protein SGARI_000293 [Bacillariaceae sp.]
MFCILRKKYPKVYDLRNWVESIQSPLAKKQFGFLSWMYKLYLISDTELLDECGMDALCYTRVLEFGVKLSAVGSLMGIILIPVYFTAPVTAETEGITDNVVKMSTTNVGSGDLRFLATVLGAYVIFGYAMYNILHEFEWFYMMRFQFLKKPLPRNYTVYVQLNSYFERFARMGSIQGGGGDGGETTSNGVLETRIAMECPNIKKKVAERDSLIAKLEHTINIETVKGQTPQDKKSGRPLVDVLYEQLDNLNQDITAMIEHVEALQEAEDYDERTRLLQNDEFGSRHNFVGGNNGDDNKSLPRDVSFSPKASRSATIQESEDFEDSLANGEDYGGTQTDNGAPPSSFHSASSMFRFAGSLASKTAGAAAGVASKTANVAASGVGAAMALFSTEDGKPMTAGFVTFSNLQAVHAARQMMQYPQPFTLEVFDAPAPDDVHWVNVGKKHKELQMGKLISFTLTTLLCLFWTIPM